MTRYDRMGMHTEDTRAYPLVRVRLAVCQRRAPLPHEHVRGFETAGPLGIDRPPLANVHEAQDQGVRLRAHPALVRLNMDALSATTS